jgi:hypothetical protein
MQDRHHPRKEEIQSYKEKNARAADAIFGRIRLARKSDRISSFLPTGIKSELTCDKKF